MDNFKRDYSEGRKNLGEILHKIKFSSYLPKIKFWHSYEFLKDKLFGTGNIRNDVFSMTTKQHINYDGEYSDLNVENDILKNILIICNYYGIKCILSSFAYFNDNSYHSNKLETGVKKQNKLRKKLSKELNCSFVDQNKFIKDKKYFVDSIHFSPFGMELLANNFGKEIMRIDKNDKS